MLKNVHMSFKNLISYIIFGIICLTFVFIGNPFFGGGRGISTEGAAAIVNGSVISIADFRKRVEIQERQYQMFFKNMPLAQRREQSKALRLRVLNELIRNEILAQSATKVGLIVPNAEILNYIVNDVKAFQEDERFQPDMYEQVLRANGLTPKTFEDQLHKDLLSNRMKESFIKALYVSNLESQRESRLKDSQVNLKFISFNSDYIKENHQPQPQELEGFLKNSQDRTQQYYDTHGSEFTSEEQIRAKHILIKAKSSDEEAKALEKIKALAERAKKEDFGQLALEASEDEGSKEKKGDLGYFSRGKMVPKFEKVAFSAQVGEISEPVKTSYGYHLIKVEDKKAAEKQSFDSVKEQIAKKLLAEDAFPKVVEALREKLKSQEVSGVDEFISRYALKWKETGDFSIDRNRIPNLGPGGAIYETLFKSAESLTPKKNLPDLIESDGEYYIVQLLDLKMKKAKRRTHLTTHSTLTNALAWRKDMGSKL